MTKDFVTERLKLKDLYPERAEVLAKEYDIDIEDLELVKKGVISEKIETVEHERAVISFINMETVDRDNEIIDPDGAILKHYNKVVPYGHDYRGLPMGKSMWIKKATKKGKRGLLAKTIFLERPPINEELYHMFTDDIAGTGPALNSWSIGFIPLEWEDIERKGEAKEGEADTRPRRKYTKWELLEYSGVMIPSNREALTEMVAKGAIKSDKLKKDIIECVGDECVIKEVITKPEETDDFIRIPVRDCKVTATITISEKQGITALYCGKIKKIRTYIFDKRPPYNWTLKKAQAWVKKHGKDVETTIEHCSQLGANFKEMQSMLELDDENRRFVEEVIEADDEESIEKAKYNCECIKCGHKLTSDKHCKDLKCPKCGGQMRRVSRPGPGQESLDQEVIELVETNKDGTQSMTVDNLVDEKVTNEITIKIKGDASELEADLERIRDKYEEIADINWGKFAEEIQPQLVAQIEGLRDEIKSLKEGRVLSEKNRKLVKQCADMLNALYEATEPPPKAEEVDLDLIKENPTDKKVNLSEQNIQDIVRDSFQTHLAKMIEEQEKTRKMIDKARGKVE